MGFNYEFPHSNYYDDDLRELISKYHELIDIYNNLQEEIKNTIDFVNNFEEHADELIDQRISVVMSLYLQRLNEIDDLVHKLEDEINKDDGLVGRIDGLEERIELLKNQILRLEMQTADKFNTLINLMHEYKHSMDAYVDSRTKALEQYIKDTVTKLDRMDVINPLTGIYEDIQNVLDEMVEVIIRSYGLTAKQYDDLELTARVYDNYRISAYDYSTRGYFELYLKLTQNLMRSPFDGTLQYYDVVINSLANLHKCALTAQEYDNRQLTAQAYDAMELTAFMYDWFSYKTARLITAGLFDSLNLTAIEYDSKNITAEEYEQGMKWLTDTAMRCGNPCNDNYILAYQIEELTHLVNDYISKVDNLPQAVSTASGISYVAVIPTGVSKVTTNAPELADDSVVIVYSEDGSIPVSIKRYGETVETDWNVDESKDRTFTITIQNKK